MTDILSLEQLVHLSLGDPEAGAVNFNVLKTLLLQMLKAMNLFNYKPTMSDDDQRTLKEALSTTTTAAAGAASNQHVESEQDERSNSDNEIKRKSQRKKRDQSSDRLNALEEKVFRFESQVNALNQIPSNSELIDRAKQLPRKTSDTDHQAKSTNRQGPILEVWQYTQMEKRIESAENGITRLASLLQDLISDMNDLKDSNETIKQTTDELKKQQDELKNIVDMLNNEKNDWAKKSDVESLDEKIRNLQNLLSSLRDHFNGLSKDNSEIIPMPDLSGFVTWDRLEDALKGIRESIEKSSNDAAAALASTQNNRPVQLIERQSQTSAKRKDSRSGEMNVVPSNGLAELLEQLGTLHTRHEQLRALVEALDQKKLNREEFEAFKNQQNGLFDRLAALERDIDDMRLQRKSDTPGEVPVREIIREVSTQPRTDYSGDMSDFRTALQRMREELDRLKQLIQDLINKGNLSAQDIDALKKLIQQMDQTKADKTFVNTELDKKADKRDVDTRVLKKDFNVACGELSQNINDCLQKFHVHDDSQKQDFDKMNHDIDGKLDRNEMDALRDYMDKQLKKLKKLAKEQQQTQQQHVHVMSEDEAAGLRKQLIRFHCISCDRPIDVQPHPQQPSLPANQGMRPIQSPRPYTTYELDQIRQYQKSQQFSNEFSGSAADVYATVRQCGGSHTMTLPFKRQIKTQPTVPEEPTLTKNEVDIKGHDGVIYKGRIDVDKLPIVDMHKKNSVVLLAPPPMPRSRSDSHSMPVLHQNQHESPINDELTRVLKVEQEILSDSQAFSLERFLLKKEQNFQIETVFNWNIMTKEHLYEINRSDFDEQWKKYICKSEQQKEEKKSVVDNIEEESNTVQLEHEEIEKEDSGQLEHHINSSCECNSELDLDLILHRQTINEIELNEETCCRLNDELFPSPLLNIEEIENPSKTNPIMYNDESTTLDSLINDILNDRITTGTLPIETVQILSPKLDKTTSTHSLSPTLSKQSNTFNDFFHFENNTSRNYNLGKHEHWIANATASYIHPFNNHPHQQCSIELYQSKK